VYFDQGAHWLLLWRVPFAFYVAHLHLIHVLSMLLGIATGFDARQFLTFFAFFRRVTALDCPPSTPSGCW